MKIRKHIISGYHRVAEEFYKLRIKATFRHVDHLIKINTREAAKLATADNWRDIDNRCRIRRRKIDALFRKERELERLRDRHWWKRIDLKAYYRA